MFDQIAEFIFGLPGGKPVAALVLFSIFSIVLYLLYKAVFLILRMASAKIKTDFDDILFANMRDPIRVLILLTAIFLAISNTYSDFAIAEVGIFKLYSLTLILVGAFAFDRLLDTFLTWYQKELAPKTSSQLDDELIPIIHKVLRVAIYVLALLMVIDNLGIEITPLLAGLGIASLAVALALQDSLGNFIAGVNITVDRPLRKGDFISTDFGVEGVVQEIGWRSTKVLTPQNNYVIMPNTKLAQSVITNYYRPQEAVLQVGQIGASYEDDVEHVIESIKRVLKNVLVSSDKFNKSFEPVVYFDSFGESSLNFKYVYSVKNYSLRSLAADEINRALFYEFKKEGISIPFPVRTIYKHDVPSEKEKSKKGKSKKGKKD